MQFFRSLMCRFAFLAVVVFSVSWTVNTAAAQRIVVQGTQRVDAETIKSYFNGTSQSRINQAVKDLYATGLFADVQVTRSRGAIIIRVRENQLINRVAFEGNSKIKGGVLAREVQSKARGSYSPATVQADVQRLKDVYQRAGRGNASVSARTVPLPNGKLDVVFTIKEGGKTGVRDIRFVGNRAISSWRLRNIMQTTEMNFLSWFKNTDVYDPEKVSADLERIRRYYLKNGYADFRVVGSDARYSEAKKGWILTFTFDEGPQYKINSVTVNSRIPDVNPRTLRRSVRVSKGETYNGTEVEKSVEALTREAARKGYAFAVARPTARRNPVTRTIDLELTMEEGPRVYIEQILIRGNTRTRDFVIRREFEIGEGDAYNKVLIDKAQRRLNDLGFFKSVSISNQPGSTPDRVIVVVDVQDKPTGSFGISGGYSTQDGIVGEVSLSEANFMGRGQYVKVSTTLGQRTQGVNLSFTEPYFMGYRMAAGFDLYHRRTRKSKYSLYESTVTGGTLRLTLPVTDEFSVGLRYSLYNTRITLANSPSRPYNDCTSPIVGFTPGTAGSPFPAPAGVTDVTCLTNGEASLAIKEAVGTHITSLAGVTFTYSTLDNMRNPTSGLLATANLDVAGLGGTAKFIRATGSIAYFYPVWDDITLFAKVQGGHMRSIGGYKLRIADNFNIGSSLVRGFAPNGLGPRDDSAGVDINGSSLGGTSYYAATVELQFPIFGMPKELGLRGAVFADAGTLFGYNGTRNFSTFLGLPAGTPCAAALINASGYPYTQSNCVNVRDSHKLRSSVGVSVLWKSPLGPIRFDYAWVLSKATGDRLQAFRFSGGSTF
ncbi:MAG: outer membrane protein assembly factor BamA [Hyphomicrobiales bacterium]|nr:outer membrane protein assembly factor BamA [Hyphomicrobiales bacterium]